MWMETVPPKDLRVLGTVQLWTVYLLLEGLLGTRGVCGIQRLIASTPNKAVKITSEEPPGTVQPAGTHTLRYDLMTFSREMSGQPRFLAQGYLDDELFLRYDGDKRTAEPWGPGFEGHGGAETWARETETLREKEEHLRKMLADVISQQSQNKALPTLQATMGCELQRNGSTRSFWNLGYAGQNFFTFDPKTLTWAMDVPRTKWIKTFWETRAPRADLVKMFLDDTCPTQLQRHLASLRNVLQDTGPPRVSVTLKKSSHGKNKLTCWAFNLYPRVANLTWLQNGKPTREHTWGPGTTLPSGDGTYQTRVSVWVLPGQEAQFTCNLRHHSQDREIPAVSEENQARTSNSASNPAASALSVVSVLINLAYTTQASKRPAFLCILMVQHMILSNGFPWNYIRLLLEKGQF